MTLFRSRLPSAGLAWLGSVASLCVAQTPSAPAPRAEEVAAKAGSINGRINIDTLATTLGPKAIPRFDGVAAAGLKVTLDGSASSGGRVWYRWIQTQGPRVTIRNADQPQANLTVPDDATTLGFVLVVGNAAGVDAKSLIVPIEDTEHPDEDLPLKAVAGPDQTVVIGRRVSLDGVASEPKGRIRYRWVQSGGPKALIDSTPGATCSFVPESVGDYQFALLVIGADDLISEASTVTIHAKSAAFYEAGDGATTGRPTMAIDELARTSLASVPGGLKYADDLSRVLDAVADRIDSYKTYLDAATEMTKRLDSVVPRAPEKRTEWMEHFFRPWNARMIEGMRANGIDLAKPDGQTKILTRAQRARLAEQFRLTAAGLRAETRTR